MGHRDSGVFDPRSDTVLAAPNEPCSPAARVHGMKNCGIYHSRLDSFRHEEHGVVKSARQPQLTPKRVKKGKAWFVQIDWPEGGFEQVGVFMSRLDAE